MLEQKLSKMNLEDEPQKPKEQVTVGNQQRKIKTVARKTAQGKAKQVENAATAKKDKALFKATLKNKSEYVVEGGGDPNDSDWESVEEDYPHVKLEELLENMTIHDKNEAESDEEESKVQN